MPRLKAPSAAKAIATKSSASPPKQNRPKYAGDKKGGSNKKDHSPKKKKKKKTARVKPIDWAYWDARLAALQHARDSSDALLLENAWYGPLARTLPRRAATLAECHIHLVGGRQGYPSLCFTVGELDAPSSIYARQAFILRNVWESGTQYWATDAEVNGVLQMRADPPDAEMEQLAASSMSFEDMLDIDMTDFMTPFTNEEHGAVEQCVVRPYVLPIDRALSAALKAFDDAELDLSAAGFAVGPTQYIDDPDGDEERRRWRRTVSLNGSPSTDALTRLRAFKALQLLSADATAVTTTGASPAPAAAAVSAPVLIPLPTISIGECGAGCEHFCWEEDELRGVSICEECGLELPTDEAEAVEQAALARRQARRDAEVQAEIDHAEDNWSAACQAAFDGDLQRLEAALADDPNAAATAGWVRAVVDADDDIRNAGRFFRGGALRTEIQGEAHLIGLWSPVFDSFGFQPVGKTGDDAPARAVPLQWAVWAGHVDAARMLVRGNAADTCDSFSCSASTIGWYSGTDEMREALDELGYGNER